MLWLFFALLIILAFRQQESYLDFPARIIRPFRSAKPGDMTKPPYHHHSYPFDRADLYPFNPYYPTRHCVEGN